MSPLTGKTNTSLPTSRRMHLAPTAKRRNHTRPVVGPLELLHLGSDSTSSKKSSHQGKCSPPAKGQPDNRDTENHSTSSKHKDRSHSDKSSRHSSDKESSNTPCKCAVPTAMCLLYRIPMEGTSCR